MRKAWSARWFLVMLDAGVLFDCCMVAVVLAVCWVYLVLTGVHFRLRYFGLRGFWWVGGVADWRF